MMSDLGKVDIVGVALAHMFVLGFMIWAGAGISGGQYNGAVTLGCLVTGHTGGKKAAIYLGCQFLGSLLAGCMLAIFKAMYTRDPLIFKSMLGYPHADVARYGITTCILTEIIATFFLVFMVFATALGSSKPKSEVYGLTIGGALGMAILSIGPITGAALNPFRVLGPSIISGEIANSAYWYAFIYYLGCPLGGVLCGLVWKFVFMRLPSEPEDADNHADDEEKRQLTGDKQQEPPKDTPKDTPTEPQNVAGDNQA